MLLSDLPATAHLWIYAADRPLTAEEETLLTQRLEDFLGDWASHGRPVEGAAQVRDGRFVLLAAHLPDHPSADVSGCGIDASVEVLEGFADETGLAWQTGLRVFYRDAEEIVRSVSRPEFEALAEQETVHAGTPVFDLSLSDLAALREGRFERPAGQSWHAEAFSLAPPPAAVS